MANESICKNSDIFHAVVNLEEQYYREGYTLGLEDGARNGQAEGRLFGLQKGFEKSLEMGHLRGRASVWSARLPSTDTTQSRRGVQTLQDNERLRKHITRLSDLTSPDDLPIDNSEEGVSEFEGRLKEALAKAVLVKRMVGEDDVDHERPGRTTKAANRNEIEDFGGLPISRR